MKTMRKLIAMLTALLLLASLPLGALADTRREVPSVGFTLPKVLQRPTVSVSPDAPSIPTVSTQPAGPTAPSASPSPDASASPEASASPLPEDGDAELPVQTPAPGAWSGDADNGLSFGVPVIPMVTLEPDDGEGDLIASPDPDASLAPEGDPEASVEPDATADPEASIEPDVTADPEASVEPDATVEPEASADPEASAEPDATADPEASAEPEASVDPEASVEPDATADPETTADPEASVEPDATADPEATLEPEVTPEPTPAPLYTYLRDENGALLLDVNGNPIVSVAEGADIPVAFQRDENGNLVLDEMGNPIPTQFVTAGAQKMLTIADQLDPNRRIDVYASWEGEELFFDDVMTLTAVLYGYDNAVYNVQWQSSKDDINWVDVEDGTSTVYSFVVTEENYLDYWRLEVEITDVTANANAPADAEAPEA